MNSAIPISVIWPISPAGEMVLFRETAAFARPEILFERLATQRCKYLISSEFLFE